MAIGLVKPINKQGMSLGQIILAVELILAAILIFLLVKIALLFVQPGGSQIIAPTNTRQEATVSSINEIDKSVLAEFDLFHRERQGLVIVQTNSAPETTLDLKVFGMRADLEGESSSAVIETPDGKQWVYRIGDEIIPGVTLQSVEVDWVILDRNGTTERLSRQGKTEGEQAAVAAASLALSTLSYPAADLIKDVRLYPHREGQKVIGYRVMPQRSGRKKLEEYGFERGDIVTSINGEDLTQPVVNLPAMFKNLKQARYANIQIIRDDVPMTIEVNLK